MRRVTVLTNGKTVAPPYTVDSYRTFSPSHDSNKNIRSHTVTRVEVLQSKSWCKITLICSQATSDLWQNDFDMKLNDFVVKKKHQDTTADTFS